MAINLRRLSYALGAEVCDVDVSAPISESRFGEIYQAFLDHCILLFRTYGPHARRIVAAAKLDN